MYSLPTVPVGNVLAGTVSQRSRSQISSVKSLNVVAPAASVARSLNRKPPSAKGGYSECGIVPAIRPSSEIVRPPGIAPVSTVQRTAPVPPVVTSGNSYGSSHSATGMKLSTTGTNAAALNRNTKLFSGPTGVGWLASASIGKSTVFPPPATTMPPSG